MQPLIILEMNEVCFNYVDYYIKQGHLKNFSKFIKYHGYCRTTSETEYDNMEPWIQWVSARTGQPFSEHGVFRLGDIVKNKDLKQHWEILEEKGLSVAACSPINGANNTKHSPFWIPDPWVDTKTSGDQSIHKLASAVKQAVNSNASAKITNSTLITLIKTLLTKTKITSWPTYITSLLGVAKRQHWSKALILDRLLGDVFFKEWNKHKPDFSTLFLNAAAHIQHHYMFNSKAYNGYLKNPDWYIDKDADPILEIYKIYDDILLEATKTGARIMVGTGLTQAPYEKTSFYYRLKSHDEFLNKLNIKYKSIEPRMSRDFLVSFNSNTEAELASQTLLDLRSKEKIKIFDIDNRGDSLFITLSYPNEISPNFTLYSSKEEERVHQFLEYVAFVAIKNGHHDLEGYFMDSSEEKKTLPDKIKIEDLFHKSLKHFKAN